MIEPDLSTPILSVRSLRKQFGSNVAVAGVDLDVSKGEKLGIIGPNGSGKTTLINCITGVLRPEGGAVMFEGTDISSWPAWRRARGGIARTFQIPRPFAGISVMQNLKIPLDYVSGKRTSAGREQELLAIVGLEARAHHLAELLTQLELRKLELARALATEPRLLIVDEVMAGLSEAEINDVLDILNGLNERGVTVLMIEHIMHAIMRFSRRLICMETGRIIADGAPSHVGSDPEVRRVYFGNKLVVDRLSAGYGAVSVLRDVSLEIGEGELVALLGTNGNGKSTLLNAILGLIRPTAGAVRLEWDGRAVPLTGLPAEAVVELGVALVPEGRRLFPHLTVQENLVLGGSGRRAARNLRANLDFVFATFPILKERRAQRAGTLSGGQQQILAIARGLMTEPRVMLIDEPSVGLAPIVVDQVLDTVKTLQAERKLTVLMAEQSIVHAIAIADRSYVLTHGRIASEFGRDQAAASAEAIGSALLGGVS